ncbi:hypothetical protein AT746_04480 [Lacimicrobium alkaliphilum]|uniref:Uncharacterized protein n=1 Tax=Lacimicrobium alkaliphilum TaxID=1526571 RepID=A0A0U3A9C1_9ALTE|nr:hypothetical protein AT746_04480 [Lacimicrobium alkaliphilum]
MIFCHKTGKLSSATRGNTVTLDFDSGLLLIGMAQGAFLSASLLLRKQGPKLANRVLGTLMLALTMGLVTHFMTVTQSWSQWPRLYIVLSTSIMLFGPLLFAYIKLLTRRQQKLLYKDALHLLPWAALLALFTPLLLMPQAQLLENLSTSARQAGPNFGLPFIKLLHLTLYTLASAIVLYQHQARVNQEYSYHDKVSLSWLRLLVAGFLLMEASSLVLVVMEPYFQLLDKLDSWLSLVLIVLIFLTGYQGLNQPQVFLGLDKPPTPLPVRKTLHFPSHSRLNSRSDWRR